MFNGVLIQVAHVKEAAPIIGVLGILLSLGLVQEKNEYSHR